jgi:ATP-binding cassette subfamily C protein LapB
LNNMKLIDHWFWSAFAEHKNIYFKVMLAATLVNLMSVGSSIFIMVVYDRVVPNSAYESLYALTMGMALIIIFDYILKMLKSYFIDYAGEFVDKKIGNSIFDRLLQAPTTVVIGPVGATANTFKEFDQVRDFFTSATLSLVVDLPFIFLFIFVIYLISGPLAVIPLVAVPVVLLVGIAIQPFLARVSTEIGGHSQEKQSVLVETISGIESVKVLGGGNLVKERWEKAATQHSSTSRLSRTLASIAVNAAQSAQQICLVGIVFYGVFLVGEGVVSMGAMVAAVLLSSRTLAPLAQIANLFGRFNNARTSYQRLSQFMQETQPEDDKQKKNATIRRSDLGGLELREVSFRYPDKEIDTLHKINLTIEEGEKVAILGRNGSGKTTLIKLATGLFSATDGLVLYDGVDAKQIHSDDLSRSIGIVLQDVQLFSGSIIENITMGREGISQDEIIAASKISGLDDFLGKMPGGYELILQDKGNGLSGGQKQAIAITRAIVHKPSHFILDEPTSAMDMNSEQQFIENFKTVASDATVLLVSHRLPLLNLVDRVIVMNEGKIVEDGPKDDVLNKLQPNN